MPDPRARDPRFPDRPTHPDFIRLSEAVQNHDAMAEQLHVNTFAIMGVDEESFMYVVRNRFGILYQRGIAPTGTDRAHLRDAHPFLVALYLDAFALGKRFGEQGTEEESSSSGSYEGEAVQAVRDARRETIANTEGIATFEIPRPDWVSDKLVAERGPYAGFQMFTREGNDAVAQVLLVVLRDAEKTVTHRGVVVAALRREIASLAKVYPEIHDTEPRGAIIDVVDAFFEEQGWTALTENLFT